MRRVVVVLFVVGGLLAGDFHIAHAGLFTKKEKIALIAGGGFALVLGTLAMIGREKGLNETMQSWMGHHKSELILKWGPPDRITEDGNGGQVFIYEFDKRGQKIEKQPYGFTETYKVKQTGHVSTRMFWIDKDGVVYNWQWKGL